MNKQFNKQLPSDYIKEAVILGPSPLEVLHIFPTTRLSVLIVCERMTVFVSLVQARQTFTLHLLLDDREVWVA